MSEMDLQGNRRGRGRGGRGDARQAPTGQQPQPPRRPGEAWARPNGAAPPPNQGRGIPAGAAPRAPAGGLNGQGAWPRPGSGSQGAGRQQSQEASGASGRSQADSGQPGRRRQGGGDVAQISSQVEGVRIEEGSRSLRRADLYSEEVLQTRPAHIDKNTKKGHCGQRVDLKANYFSLPLTPDFTFYQYRVDYKPEEDSTFVRKMLLLDRRAVLGPMIFDGTVLFLRRCLEKNEEKFFATRRRDDQIIEISCKYIGDVRWGNAVYLQVLNVLLKKMQGYLRLVPIRNDFFDPLDKTLIPTLKMDLWPGYRAVIGQHEEKLLLCAEIKFKEMRQDTCLRMLEGFVIEDKRSYQRRFTQEIVGQVVMTYYNNKFYRIDDVDWGTNPSKEWRQGETYIGYMKRKHNIVIRDGGQPMLIHRSSGRDLRAGLPEYICLIPEVCMLTGKSESMRNNMVAMRTLANHTRLSPGRRKAALLAFINRLTNEPKVDEESNQWGVKIKRELIDVTGRCLPNQEIVFGQNKGRAGRINTVDWSGAFRSSHFPHSIHLEHWAVVYPTMLTHDTKVFVQNLRSCGEGMGFIIAEPHTSAIANPNPGTYVECLKNILDGSRKQIVLCIFTNAKTDQYNAVKKLCCVDRGVPSQVVTARVLRIKGLSVATKVAIQMGCKIGCSPWFVTVQENVHKAAVMVVGFDVYHKPGQRERSHGAMVSSMNSTFGQYFSTASPHTQGEELSRNFSVHIIRAVKEYQRQNNGKKPGRILIYRDGVGDGQVGHVVDVELQSIKKNLKDYYGHDPPLAFIIVSKRIRTRFFRGEDNPLPGTVVDDVVTNPNRYDFFLVSQSVKEGTVTPTNYNIIHDSSGFSANDLQLMTYKLCHMYYNWPGPVRVPAPCQYAHKMAYQVGEHLQRGSHAALETTLFYL